MVSSTLSPLANYLLRISSLILITSLHFTHCRIQWLELEKPFQLDCKVDSFYQTVDQSHIYTWTLNETVVVSGPTEHVYKVPSANQTHVGEWRCQISSKTTSESFFSHRIVAKLAFWQEPDPDALKKATQEAIHLYFAKTSVVTAPVWLLKSVPEPKLEWFDDAGSVSRRPTQYYTTQNGSLVIFEPKQMLSFRAVATNTVTKQQYTFYINPSLVDANPEPGASFFLVKPQDVSVVLAESVTFECIPRSNDVLVEWYRVVANKDGGFERQRVDDNLEFQIANTRGIYLRVKYVQLSDAGEYHCIARGTSHNASAKLTVNFAPVFPTDAVDREQTVDLDGSVQWQLSAVGSPAPNSSWYFNGKQLIPPFMDSALQLLDQGGLMLKQARLDHSGFYQCIAENVVDETIFTIRVQVQASPPQIISQSSKKTVQNGDSVSFNCRAIGAPQPKIIWTRNGDILDQSSNDIDILSDGQLLIRSAGDDDEGTYTCFAMNSRGNASTTSQLRVMTKTRIVLPPQNNSAQIGSSVQFFCSIQSDPRSDQPPKVTWLRNRVSIDFKRDSRFAVTSNYSLFISQIRSDDGGNYECKVESSYGSDSKSATLTVLELPFPPIILAATPMAPEQPRAVKLVWSPGFDGNSPVLNFIVESLDIKQGNDWVEHASFPAGVEKSPYEETLRNLLPSRTYAFRVKARNSLGAGIPSSPSLNVTLPAQPPSGPPQAIVASSPSNSSIVVQWQPPSLEHQNGEISAYKIRYRLSGYNPPLQYQFSNEIGALQRSYEIDGLIPHKQYDVSIAAINEKGLGIYSNDEKVWTKQGRPSVPPQNVDAKPVNSTAVEVSWSPPDPQKINGILSHYRIFLNRVDAKDSQIGKWVPFDATSMRQNLIIGSLAKYANYSVQIAAETEGGMGPLSEAGLFVRTLEDRPEAPASLTIVDNVDTSMTAVWQAPEHSNGVLTQFIVIYEPRQKGQQHHTTPRKILVNPDRNNVTLTNLIHDTLYMVSVSASTRMGEGPTKQVEVKSGVKPELADPPSDIEVVHDNITSQSVVISFQPGNDRGSPVYSYFVEMEVDNGVWVGVCNATPFNYLNSRYAVTVSDLQPFQVYKLRLFPVNAAGMNSEPSRPSPEFRTSPTHPSRVKSPVLVRSVNSSCLVVKWPPLNQLEWHGTGQHYLVEYRDVGSKTVWQHVKTHGPMVNAAFVNNLKPWTSYDVRVTSVNEEIGKAPQPSETSSWRTWESVPRESPTLVTSAARNSSCISASWRELAMPQVYANGIILGYTLYADSEEAGVQSRRFYGNKTLSGVICGLLKYTEYHISVSAFTRMGDGPKQPKTRLQRTGVDLPDAPASIYFSMISDTYVEMWWEEPKLKGADEILGYRIRAVSDNAQDVAPIYYEVPANVRNFTVAGLRKDTQYRFMVGTKNNIGWSLEYANQLVYTFSRQVEATAMRPPKQPLNVAAEPSEPDSMGNHQPASITITWRAPFDAYLPVRNYSLQMQTNDTEDSDQWVDYDRSINWNETSYIVSNLEPPLWYRFRIYAHNDAGIGIPSEPTQWARPSLAPPHTAPQDLVIKPIDHDAVQIEFRRVENAEFYDILYCQLQSLCLERSDYLRKRVAASFISMDRETYKIRINNLEQSQSYEFLAEALNKYGVGPRSETPFLVYVGDVVPPIAPINVQGRLENSGSSINVSWDLSNELAAINSSLIGFSVVATPKHWVSREQPQVLKFSVPISERSYRIEKLAKYTEYLVTVAAMSLGGDGPPSKNVDIETPEDLPTEPTDVRFTDVFLNEVTLRWHSPLNPNGNVTHYEITCDQLKNAAKDEKAKFKSVKVEVPADQNQYTAHGLTEGVTYQFSIRAATSKGTGPATEKSVTTEPPMHAPNVPENLQALFSPQLGYVRLSWENPHTDERIIGYLVDVRRVVEFPTRDKPAPVLPWIRVFSTNSPHPTTQVSLDVLPSGVRGADVQFRVAARSPAGQSWFSQSSQAIYVPRPGELALLDGRPYYLQHWFLGLIALGMLLVLTILVSSLIVSGYRRRHVKTGKHQQRLGVITGDHRRSGFGRPQSHIFGNEHDSGLNPVVSADLAASNASSGASFGLNRQRHNIYNSSIQSRNSRSRRPRGGAMAMHSDSEAPLWHMNVHVAKAKVQVNKVNRSRPRSPPRPSLAGYEPSESTHSASTSVIGGPSASSSAPHYSAVPSANAIASELASITGAKQRLTNGYPASGGNANSALDDFSGSRSTSPNADDDQQYNNEHNDKQSIPADSDDLNDSVAAQSTFHAGQPVYGQPVSNYASTASIRMQQQQQNATLGYASSTTSFGYATPAQVQAQPLTVSQQQQQQHQHQAVNQLSLNNVAGNRQPLTGFSSFV